MSNINNINDELKKQHLLGLHKGKEEELQDSCILCEKYINAKKKGTLKGKDLNLFVSDDLPLIDKFG